MPKPPEPGPGAPFAVRSGTVVLRGDSWPAPEGAATAVLVPGGGQNRASWARTARRLADRGHGVLALDIRGHGESDRAPDGDYGACAFAADLRAVCAALSGPVVLVGASLSGLASLLAMDGPQPCAAALVMVDIAIDSRPEGVDRVQGFLREVGGGYDTLEALAEAVAGYTGRPGPPERLLPQTRRDAAGRWYLHWDPAFMANPPDFDAQRDRLLAAARALAVPALLVRGERSDVVTDADADAMRALMRGLRVVDVGGAGHMITGDDNDPFAAGLADFLDEVAGGGGPEVPDDAGGLGPANRSRSERHLRRWRRS